MQHFLVRLEIGIGFRDGQQAAERAREHRFSAREFLHGRGVAGILGGLDVGGRGDVAGGDDGLQRAALVLEITFGGLDEIGDEVVTALELHVNLRVGVLETIAEGDEMIVAADDVERDNQRHGEENSHNEQQNYHKVP